MAKLGINISATLINKLPKHERDDVAEVLWTKSAGKCFLCEAPLKRASESIEADHDIPESESGPTTLSNLNLAHAECNRAKRASPTVDVRPYLRLAVFIKAQGGFVRYAECLKHFSLSPAGTHLERKGDQVAFAFSDGSERSVPLFKESLPAGKKNEPGKKFTFVFVDVPRSAIFNDDKCQPRTIKLGHVWLIYTDLQRNPLHEPPGCRLEPTKGGLQRLLMFDGQHKTVASWMRGNERIVVKVYLDLDQASAIELVNSIQSKIKKLPLSPFELVAKMADEWANKVALYEEEVGSSEASEAGFIGWLGGMERRRGKQAFEAALMRDVMDAEDLRFRRYVIPAGSRKPTASITENVFKTKVLQSLIYLKPLTEKAANTGGAMRARELANIVSSLNAFTDLAFEPQHDAEMSAEESERMRRLSYQSSLAQVSALIKSLYRHHLVRDDDQVMMAEPTSGQWDQIGKGIERIVEHPIWKVDLSHSAKTRDVEQALAKNQDARRAFNVVGLNLGYVVTGELPSLDD